MADTTRALVGIALGVAGTVIMAISFVNGVAAALDASGSGAGGWIALFLAGGAMALAAIILGVVGLARGRSRLLSAIALVAGLIPVLLVVALRVAAG